MRELRRIAVIAGVVMLAVLAIGINRTVVTDGRIDSVAMHAPPKDAQVVAFKSDYLPLDK